MGLKGGFNMIKDKINNLGVGILKKKEQRGYLQLDMLLG